MKKQILNSMPKKSILAMAMAAAAMTSCHRVPPVVYEDEDANAAPDTMYVVGVVKTAHNVNYIQMNSVLADKEGKAFSSYNAGFSKKHDLLDTNDAFIMASEAGDTVLARRVHNGAEIVRNITRENIARSYKQR